ncbi:MAG: DPP IV N-terminal domain-containing protein, partial [Verrucomicrobiota bacterium]|nr:DPP IV N-terminal domain-containing protein [Verrucomicrobiota bacterium]
EKAMKKTVHPEQPPAKDIPRSRSREISAPFRRKHARLSPLLPFTMHTRIFRLELVLLTLLLASPLRTEADRLPPASRLTLERIHGTEEFKGKQFELRWLEDGERYTFLRKITEGDHEGKREIRLAPAGKNEQSQLLVAAGDLVPEGAEQPLTIDGYSFSSDLSLLLLYTNSKRVWRRKSRGDYWIFNRTSRSLRQLGGEDSAPSSLMFAKLSPDGKHVAYVRGPDIHLESLPDHTIRTLTTSNSNRIFNGRFDWVYEEELGVRDGFRWSPDSHAIAYWQFDESGVRRHTMLDHVSGRYPGVTRFGYPKVGQKNAACRGGVVEIDSGKTTWLQIPGDPREHYLARMEWAGPDDSTELILQQLNRAQDTKLVMLAQRRDGSVRTILKEHDPAWVVMHNDLHWDPKGASFTWTSERDDWEQLYRVSRDGKEITKLTPDAFDVDLQQVDRDGRWAYFLASPDNPAQRFLYRVGLNGQGLTRLTPGKEKRGTHSYRISPTGAFAVWTRSDADTPSVTRLISLPDHKVIKVLEDNADLHRRVDALKLAPVEFFQVEIAEGIRLPARCIRPSTLDQKHKYPLLIYVYGEPAGQVVRDSWGGLWHHMLAQQGYVIMSFDNRGSRSPLGRTWRREAFRKIGILPPRDQAAAVRSVLRKRPWLDPERVGSWGWSGGGSMSLNAIFKFPDLYQTAIAVASVPDQRHYDTIYQERYMGLPTENRKAFREGSPINFAQNLEGNLLLIHGAADDNCHYQTYLKLVDKLIEHNKPFSMMTYPRGTHSINEGKNARRHVYETMTRFLHAKMPPGPR